MLLSNFFNRAHHVYRTVLLTSLLCLFTAGSLSAQTINFVVQPISSPEQTRKTYQPVIDYLEQQTGENFKLVTAKSFLSYWETMKRNQDYHLIMDAAHFTDYRVSKMGYRVLAKMPETVSFALITNEENLILETDELVGKSVATLPPPSIGSVRMSQMFPHPARQPEVFSASSAAKAIADVKNGKYQAALVPTPLLNNHPDVNIIKVTEPIPHMAISASPQIPALLQEKIQNALVNAHKSEQGSVFLSKLAIVKFEPANNRTYKGYSQLLAGVWGY
jgi:ABC-type phosphate/phosphonate transport system substrate-binding protein